MLSMSLTGRSVDMGQQYVPRGGETEKRPHSPTVARSQLDHETQCGVEAEETTVLIVGGGPAGLTTALALARYGTAHILVNKHESTAHTPRAHIVNQRTVEIMRHLGCEADLHAVATPQEIMRHNLWVTSLAGHEVARLDAWGTGARQSDYDAASPCPMVNCAQTDFEPMLLAAARKAESDVRFGHEFLGYRRVGDWFLNTIRERSTGKETTIRSRYLVGADGAKSTVLDLAGLTVEGRSAISHAVNIWFRADLSKYLAHRPGVLIWNVAPGPLPSMRHGTLICHKPFNEFVLVRSYDPDTTDLTTWTLDHVRPMIEEAVGAPTPDVELLGVAGWQVNALVAPKYSSDDVFCMGDAVHRHPPTNGLGLNMSVADAFNLAWKLALVDKGIAGPALLDTYSSERQPVGAAGVARAVTSAFEGARFERGLGYVRGQSEADGWAELDLLSAPGAAGETRRAALAEQVEIAHNQFNAHGIELGYCYDNGAVVHDENTYSVNPRDPVRYYHPTTRPGARLPHAWLERNGTRTSTLDLVDGLSFVLLSGPQGHAWIDAAHTVASELRVDINVHLIDAPNHWGSTDGTWRNVREIDDSGCVLVRPDRHVAWRSLTRVDNATTTLRRVVSLLMNRHS